MIGFFRLSDRFWLQDDAAFEAVRHSFDMEDDLPAVVRDLILTKGFSWDHYVMIDADDSIADAVTDRRIAKYAAEIGLVTDAITLITDVPIGEENRFCIIPDASIEAIFEKLYAIERDAWYAEMDLPQEGNELAFDDSDVACERLMRANMAGLGEWVDTAFEGFDLAWYAITTDAEGWVLTNEAGAIHAKMLGFPVIDRKALMDGFDAITKASKAEFA